MTLCGFDALVEQMGDERTCESNFAEGVFGKWLLTAHLLQNLPRTCLLKREEARVVECDLRWGRLQECVGQTCTYMFSAT